MAGARIHSSRAATPILGSNKFVQSYGFSLLCTHGVVVAPRRWSAKVKAARVAIRRPHIFTLAHATCIAASVSVACKISSRASASPRLWYILCSRCQRLLDAARVRPLKPRAVGPLADNSSVSSIRANTDRRQTTVWFCLAKAARCGSYDGAIELHKVAFNVRVAKFSACFVRRRLPRPCDRRWCDLTGTHVPRWPWRNVAHPYGHARVSPLRWNAWWIAFAQHACAAVHAYHLIVVHFKQFARIYNVIWLPRAIRRQAIQV